jgi:hypothetical protein
LINLWGRGGDKGGWVAFVALVRNGVIRRRRTLGGGFNEIALHEMKMKLLLLREERFCR